MAHNWLVRWWSNKDNDEPGCWVWEFDESNEDVVCRCTVFPNPSCQVLNVTTHISRLTKSSFLNLAPFQSFSGTRSVLLMSSLFDGIVPPNAQHCLASWHPHNHKQYFLPDVDFKSGIEHVMQRNKPPMWRVVIVLYYSDYSLFPSKSVYVLALSYSKPINWKGNGWKWCLSPAQSIWHSNPTA